MVELVVFICAGAACLAGAIGVVASRNPVHAALSLVGTLFGIAVLFVAQEANFLAAVQVIVYAGAIVVLFLFVIMFLGVDQSDDLRVEPLGIGQRIAAGVLGLGLVGLVLVALADTDWEATGVRSAAGSLTGDRPDIDILSEAIFTRYVFAFELTSVLLVIAVVGAVLLARRTPRADEIVDPGQAEREAEVEDRITRAAMHAYGLQYQEGRTPGPTDPTDQPEPEQQEAKA
ncbi:MAG: NADH-quinone oxidoreductase subunit J [Acidimicrobiales bacterium]